MKERWEPLLAELARRKQASREMGGTERLDRHRGAGKLDARTRMAALFDDGVWTEIGAFAGEEGTPADGLLAGFGKVDGRPVLCGVEDVTVLGGSIGDVGADKRYRLTQLALQERVPLVFMLEGAGHRLTNIHPGRRPNDLQGLADLSGKVPMVCLVLGASAGHGALTAPLSDFVVMSEQGSMFVAGPPIVKAAIGETVTKEALGGPAVHLASGVAHNRAADDGAAIRLARRYLGYFPSNAWLPPPAAEPDDGPRLLEGILELVDPDPGRPFDMRLLLGDFADRGSLLEIQPEWGGALVTALVRLGGRAVAIVANNPASGAGAVDAAAAQKAARFLTLADAFHLPVVFLTDNPGVMPGSASERSAALRHAARMFAVQHGLRVPKVHVTLRKAFGFGSSLMAMNPFDGQTISLAFPAVTLGAMPARAGADAARLSPEEKAKAEADQAGSACAMAGKLAFDAVIDPRDLRNELLAALALTSERGGEYVPRPGGILP
ncbi:acetyl-CoA carboxylase carboxyltransferase subunit [Altererythrobacter aerius]|uniref:Acetyl-CoA carboxylase carboxyltransferase subunit n=1 Tax=Tsuneonella aeria TaxID=1837929 RepID=A0A6I4T9Z5_9SPHN|nr:carboxyl transferase domain-containing protein [Tsuneonella aeria]MXO74349.1 acetyl-CoA carboxylase carboxyltransferase subunit [Tsuneonella aeria]